MVSSITIEKVGVEKGAFGSPSTTVANLLLFPVFRDIFQNSNFLSIITRVNQKLYTIAVRARFRHVYHLTDEVQAAVGYPLWLQ